MTSSIFVALFISAIGSFAVAGDFHDGLHCSISYIYDNGTAATVAQNEEHVVPIIKYDVAPTNGVIQIANELNNINITYAANRRSPTCSGNQALNMEKSIKLQITADNVGSIKPPYIHDNQIMSEVTFGDFHDFRFFLGAKKLQGKDVNVLSVLCTVVNN